MRPTIKLTAIVAAIVALATCASLPTYAKSPPLVYLGAGATLHGPIVIRDERRRIVLRLDPDASIQIAPH